MMSRILFNVCAAASLMLSVALLPNGTPSAYAQVPIIPPTEVALTPVDLPTGYELEPESTRFQPIFNIGLGYTVAMKRDATPENLGNGPVRVWQYIVRVDRESPPVDVFAQVRDQIILDHKLELFPGGTNTETSAQLIGDADVDGKEQVVYAVGRVRDNLIWFTLVRGDSPGTTIQSALVFNDISSAKYERFRSSSGPPALADALFLTSFLSDELPPGFKALNIIRANVSDRALAHNGIAEIDLDVDGPGVQNRITFIVYASEVHAQASFADAPVRAVDRGSLLARPDGYDYPALCAMRGTEMDQRMFGATTCLGLIGNVEVSTLSLMADSSFGSMSDALALMEAGVKHLRKVASATTGVPQ